MLNKIIKQIHFFQNAYGITNLKIVMKQSVYDELIKDNSITETANQIEGVPIEINDKIIVDFYVTEKIGLLYNETAG